MPSQDKLFHIYAAVTDCLPAFKNAKNQKVRPIKIGKARCLRERFDTINAGYPREESVPAEKSLPLAGCTRWRMIAASKRVFLGKKAEAMEKVVRGALKSEYRMWWTFDMGKAVEDAAGIPPAHNTESNGLTEIVNVDLEASENDNLFVALQGYANLWKLTSQEFLTLKNLILEALLSLNDHQPSISEIACLAKNCWMGSANEQKNINCSHILKSCQSGIHQTLSDGNTH